MKNFFQQLSILYLGLLAGQIIFAGVVYFLVSQRMADGEPFDPGVFRVLVPLAILGGAGTAYFLHRQRQAQGAEIEGVSAKAEHYRASVILRSAMQEGVNLFAIIAALVTQDMTFLLYFAVGLLAFLYFRPSREELSRDYGINPQDLDNL